MKKITFLLFIITSISVFGQDKLTSSLEGFYNGTDWVNSGKTEYLYDSNNNLIEETELSWNTDTSEWNSQYKTLYTYNSDSKVITELYQNFNPNTNTISSQERTTNSYNSNGDIIQALDAEWNGTAWINSTRFNLSFSNDKPSTILRYNWDGSTWVIDEDSEQTTLNYNANNKFSSTIESVWDGTNWVAENRSVYSYDTNERLILIEYQEWENSNWVTEDKDEFTYDANGNIITEKYSYLDNGTFHSSSTTFTFDTSKLMSSFVHPFKDKTGLDFLFSTSSIINKILGESDNDGNYRTMYNYGEATASINEFNKLNFRAYPNPTSGFLKVDVANLNIEKIELFNVLGRKIFATKNTELDFSNLSKGIYLLKIETTEGKNASKRIVKN